MWPHTSTTIPAPGVMKFKILIDPPQLIITVNSGTQKAMVVGTYIYTDSGPWLETMLLGIELTNSF